MEIMFAFGLQEIKRLIKLFKASSLLSALNTLLYECHFHLDLYFLLISYVVAVSILTSIKDITSVKINILIAGHNGMRSH